MSGLGKAPSLPLEKVEWRVDGKPFKWGSQDMCRYVPYMDARDAATLLDEWVGPANWSDEYAPVKGVDDKPAMWCHLSIKDGDEWVTKRDVGVASNFEAMKGIVSDSFKRVATIKWGVGRNVYDLPTITAPCRVDDKDRAWPVDGTLPYILDELAKQGFDAETGRVAEQDVQTDAEPPTPAQAPSEQGGGATPEATAEDGNTAPKSGGDVSPSSPSGSPSYSETVRAIGAYIAGDDTRRQIVQSAIKAAYKGLSLTPPAKLDTAEDYAACRQDLLKDVLTDLNQKQQESMV